MLGTLLQLVVLTGLLRVVSLGHLAGHACKPLRHAARPGDALYRAKRVFGLIDHACAIAPWRVSDLARSLLALRQLRAHSIDATLFYAVSPIGDAPYPIEVMAWVGVDQVVLAKRRPPRRFVVVATFPPGRFDRNPVFGPLLGEPFSPALSNTV